MSDSKISPRDDTEAGPSSSVELDWKKRKVVRVLYGMHLAAALLMALEIAVVCSRPIAVDVPQTVGFPSNANRTGPVAAPQVRVLEHDVNVTALVAVFLGLACADHLAAFFVGILRPLVAAKYLYFKENNPLRWAEYSVSASVMSVTVAALCGVYDVHMQFLIGASTGVCMALGWAIDAVPKVKELRALAWGLFALGTLCCVCPWVVMWCYFVDAKGKPAFVFVAFLGTFIAFMSFAVNMMLQRFFGLYSFRVAEGVYVTLSYTAKTYLAFSVWGGFRASEK
eukprot:m51a1_g12350 hypothetical protein (282) ;mRNA; f:540686-541594